MNIKQKIKNGFVYFDGATGTMLHKEGFIFGDRPEEWNITHRELLIELHKKYLDAGSDVITANTFASNRLHFTDESGDFTCENVIRAGIENAKEAIRRHEKEYGGEHYVALDIASLGKLLKPYGEIEFEEAVSIFSDTIKFGEKAGADLILIETMTDCYETKAAILAAKENSSLPIFVSTVFGDDMKMMSGTDVISMLSISESLGVDAVGVNCSLGPKQILPIVKEFLKYSSLPVIAYPNAGLPKEKDGETFYDVEEEEFSDYMREYALLGVHGLGGCCGTTPDYIRKIVEKTKDLSPLPIKEKDYTVVSSYGKSVVFGEYPVLIGERINPTGKPKFKQALRENNISYIVNEASQQKEKNVDILDINVGLPEIDEKKMITDAVKSVQEVINLPLQIDTSDIDAMESAMRIYNGKPMINSVNGKEEVMEAVFPLVKKYGGTVVALTLDENGIPDTADGRIKIAEKIYKKAESYGIKKKDIVVDTLALTISSEKSSAITTLEAIGKIKQELNGKTILGVSNISFGLPERDNVNSTFFTLAMQNGLDSAIINPFSEKMLASYYSFCALKNCNGASEKYIEFACHNETQINVSSQKELSLSDAIEKGMKIQAAEKAGELLIEKTPLEIIEQDIIPALDRVGDGFEKKTVYLPQLLMSAEAAKFAFDKVKSVVKNKADSKKGQIILATVKGDIHDIGKNIVKVLLENYGYDVIDLGKDVSPEKIAEVVKEKSIRLVGLSALMTTTVSSMKDTIDLLKKCGYDGKTVVGGAVLTKEYADSIGADKYASDAMETVRYAGEILG